MSEELLQITPITIGRYLFYKLGASTLSQLKKEKIVKKFSTEIATKKPDGLIVLPGGDVKAVIEYKQPSELKNKAQIAKAIAQEAEVAAQLCRLLIVTDGNKTFWLNPFDLSPILMEDGSPLSLKFNAKELVEGKLTREELLNIESLIDKIDHSVTPTNSKISPPSVLDPSSLAKTIWQKIWINTGKEPEKCLYNVVELFVFKFLSDIGVLNENNNFRRVYTLMQDYSAADALKHYANICRKEIRELFPQGEDGTTIINGTIFVNQKGEANISQAYLFGEVLKNLQEYDSEYGSFKYIQKEFKTRLYEDFLRQQAGIKSLGQYFTPRNVVKAMVAMSTAGSLGKGARVCDPFCGVGGFLLEAISENNNILSEFEPKNGKVNPQISLFGFDKGTDEKEDERTIILAKANMLIYFSDLLVKYHSKDYLKSFSEGAFNKVFKLIRSNLGTFEMVSEEPFDLILTNPPYVTSGSSSIKKVIDESGLSKYYSSGGRGTESLSLEWIVRNLKQGGQALIVVPDGLMNQGAMLEYLKSHCIIQAVISLPTRTFYSTPKKTYILAFKRKSQPNEVQSTAVFTYLVSEIGETRDTKRFSIVQNDLIEAVSLFNQFKGSPNTFKSSSLHCKLLSYVDFSKKSHWMVDRWWDKEERIALGVETDHTEMDVAEFACLLEEAKGLISQLQKDVNTTVKGSSDLQKKEVSLDDPELFTIKIGKRVLKKDVLKDGIPVYSANVIKPFGYIKKSNLTDFSQPALLWGIDGIFDWNYIPEGNKFATTDHCGILYVKHKNILPKYVYFILKASRERYGFDRTYRASMENIRDVVQIEIPINKKGEFDLKEQEKICLKYETLFNGKAAISNQLQYLESIELTMES